jgi:phenylalanine-4-hydroxylase
MATAFQYAAPYLIEQSYERYSEEQHATWTELVHRRAPQIERFACQEYLEGARIIGIDAARLPSLQRITERLKPRTGWSTTAVGGFLPAPAFFEMLANREFPSTTWLRDPSSLEYTPEPDIFHDVFGHVPMHAHPVFAEFLERYGRLSAATNDPEVLEQLGRLFWYTVEFGLVRQRGELKMFGSGIISSHGESTAILEGKCEVKRFDLETVLQTTVKVDEIHKVLYAIESFDEMYDALLTAEAQLIGAKRRSGDGGPDFPELDS